MDKLFLIVAIPMGIGTLAAIILARLCYLRFAGLQLDDSPATREQST